MKRIKCEEVFLLEKPFAEPEQTWTKSDGMYVARRIIHEDGSTVWYGLAVNWKKEKDGPWTVLSTNEDAKPLEKYLPDIVYGEDRTYWKECEMPLYEKMYQEL